MTRKAAKTGKELERWVANAYREMGARKVEHDVELAGNQIDVYVELETPSCLLHRIAVEAKDWTSTVGIDIVNEFAAIVKLLRSKGLIDEGVVVSASGFSKQARNAGREHSIQLLESADLTAMVAKEKGTRLTTSPSPAIPVGQSAPRLGEDEQSPPPLQMKIVTVQVRRWLIRLFRDPLWQGIGAVIAIITLIITLCPRLNPTSTPTPTRALTSTPMVALRTYHDRYVTAMGHEGNWLLGQEPELRDCGWFTLQRLDDDKIALVTCHNKYATASKSGTTDLDWALKQETDLGACGQFTRTELAGAKVTITTCADRYFTALNDNRPLETQWLVIAQTGQEGTWERFTLEQQ